MLPGLHPFVVHFPVALTLTAWLLLVVSALARGRFAELLAIGGTLTICLAAGLALVALATGLGAVLDLHVTEAAHQAIGRHSKWALFTSCALLLVAVWRGAGVAPATRPSGVYLVALTATAAALVVTALHGHQNVFQFGVGVSN